jgi:hypothetical protein
MTVNAPFSQQLSANGDTPITWTVTSGALPTGMVLSSSGLLSGTPASAGAYNFTVTASNAAGAATQAYTGSVTASAVAPTIITTSLDPMNQGSAFTQTLSATGTTPITYALASGALPGGITLSSAGVLSGTPVGAGAYNFTVRATNSGGFDDQAFSGTISASAIAPTITTTALNTLTVGTVFSQTLSASGTVPLTWTLSSGSLPAGILLTANTGVLSGTPTTAGAYSFTITATNSAGSDPQAYTGAVVSAAVAPTIVTATLNAMTQDAVFNQTIVATGTTPITWGIISGGVAGLTLNTSTGALSGTPTTAGSYTMTVRATNSQGFNDKVYSGLVAAGSTTEVFALTPTTQTISGPLASLTDAGFGAWLTNQFYAAPTFPSGAIIKGVRLYVPSGSSLIGQSGAIGIVKANPGQKFLYDGSNSSGVPNAGVYESNGTKTAFSAPLVEGVNDYYFASVWPVAPGDGFLLGYRIDSSGGGYLYNAAGGPGATSRAKNWVDLERKGVYLSEDTSSGPFPIRARYMPASGSGNINSQAWYGLSPIIESPNIPPITNRGYVRKTIITTKAAGTADTVSFKAASVGGLLVAVANGPLTSTTPSGWTLGATALVSTAGYVWYKTATAGESSFSTVHNGSGGLAVSYVVYEFPPGTTFAGAVGAAVGPTAASPSLALTGTNQVFAFKGGNMGAISTDGVIGVNWTATGVTLLEDVMLVSLPSAGDNTPHWLSVSTALGASMSSFAPTGAVVASGDAASVNGVALTFAVK